MATFQQLDDLYSHGNLTLTNLDALISQLEDCAEEQASTVAFVSDKSSMSTDDAPKNILVKLYTAGGQPLQSAVTINVQDGGGTAQPGVHYKFSPSSIQFPVNSPDGATQSVTVTPISGAITSDKTAILKVKPGKLGTIAKHELEITTEKWGYHWDFRFTDGGFTFDSEAGESPGIYVGGDGFHGYEKSYLGRGCANLSAFYDCGRKSATFDIPANCQFTSIKINLDPQGANGCDHYECYIGTSRANGLQPGRMYIYGAASGDGDEQVFGDIGAQNGVHCTFQFAGADTGDFYGITLYGTGDPPNFSGGTPFTP